jgi:DNA invertase Pin-like site-specific DNA recombinase
VAYIRVSDEREGMVSPELQLASIEAHCEKFGYSIVETLEDLDLSGRFWKRRQVEKAVGMIERREADVVVVWKISRVARNRKDWAIALDRVEGIGGRLESATEPMDTSTSSGRFARGMLAELAVFESERIGETWKETHARRLRNGLPHHGTPRFGYTYSKETGYVPDPVSGPVLAGMYQRFINGASIHEVGAYAASEGFKSDTGWRMANTRRMLDKGFGAGYLWVKGELVKGAHEPVITEEQWNAYRVRREARAAAPRSESTEYAYSGLLRCFCGSRMTGSRLTRSGRYYHRYVCTAAQQKKNHKQTSLSETLVEKAVLEWLQGIAAEIDAAAAGKVSKPADSSLGRKLSQIKADLGKNAARIDALLVKYLDGDVNQEAYLRMNTKLEEEKAALESRQRLVEVNATAKPTVIVPQLLEQWDKLPPRGKREILRRLLDRIEVADWAEGKRSITPKPVWEE